MINLIIEEALRSCPQDQVIRLINSTHPVRKTLRRYGRAFRGCRPIVTLLGTFGIEYASALADEAMDIWELVPEIVRIIPEPGTISYEVDSERHRYTPDYLLYLHDGRRIVVEVKMRKEAALPANQLRWEIYAAIFAQCGATFVVLTDEQIRDSVLRANVGEIKAQKDHRLTDRTERIIHRWFIEDEVPFVVLAVRIGDRRQALAAIAQRRLKCDLYTPLNSTLVWRI